MRFAMLSMLGFLLAADTRAEEPKPRLDAERIPLPSEAVRRLGSAKFLAGKGPGRYSMADVLGL